jgi:dTDP-4-dehydrorhamnose 3,5-epimerase
VRVLETPIAGVLILEPDAIPDARGFFARIWDRDVLTARGLDAEVAQASIAWNEVRGTLRGLHFQESPHSEAKTVSCVAGAVWDVAVDLRPEAETFHRWVGVELSASNRRSLYVPHGCAHGYLTLSDSTEVHYRISVPHRPESARGVRWNDPTLAIEWPGRIVRISDVDAALPLLGP